MDTEISDLPNATLPLSGSEALLMVQGTGNVRASLNTAQVLPIYGDLPTTAPIGAMIHVGDAVGGPTPTYWDGSNWRVFGTRGVVKTTGLGFWIVGGGFSPIPSFSMDWITRRTDNSEFGDSLFDVSAPEVTGKAWVSADAINWVLVTSSGVSVANYMTFGVNNLAYANGHFVISGSQGVGAGIVGLSVPNPLDQPYDPDFKLYTSPPYAYASNDSANALNATQYDNDTGRFTILLDQLVGPPTTTTIQNPLPSAISPPSSGAVGAWPVINPTSPSSENIHGERVSGFGIKGPMDVRITQTSISYGGADYDTQYVESAPMGTEQWQVVLQSKYIIPSPAGFTADFQGPAANVVFVGPVFGSYKATAVQFAPGSE